MTVGPPVIAANYLYKEPNISTDSISLIVEDRTFTPIAFTNSSTKNTNLIIYRFFRLNIKRVTAINTKLTEAYLNKDLAPDKRAQIEDEDIFLIDSLMIAVSTEDKSHKKGTKHIGK